MEVFDKKKMRSVVSRSLGLCYARARARARTRVLAACDLILEGVNKQGKKENILAIVCTHPHLYTERLARVWIRAAADLCDSFRDTALCVTENLWVVNLGCSNTVYSIRVKQGESNEF